MITVAQMADVLKKDGIFLLAGQNGAAFPIDYVYVQELDREWEGYREKGLILTTFNDFKKTDRILKRLDWLKEIGVSAVGFNVAVFKEIPQVVIERATDLELPLFYIPEEIPYHLVFERFNGLLAAEANQIREEIQSINESMLEAVLMEKDTHHIIQMIGKFIKVPVCYLNEALEVLSYWNGSSFSKMDILQTVKDQIIKNGKDLFLEASLSKRPRESSEVAIGEKTIPFTIIPITRQKDLYGFLLIGAAQEKALFNEVIIKHGVTALMIDAIRRSAITKYQKNQDILLFESIIREELHRPVHSHSFSFNADHMRFVFVAESADQSTTNEMFDFLYQLLIYWDSRSIIWMFDNKITGITFQQIPTAILKRVAEALPQLSIGISKKVSEFQASVFRKMYSQALIASRIGKEKGEVVNYWEGLGVDKLLYVAGQNGLFADYAEDVLQPLLREDEETGGELAITLYTYLQTFFSLKESAEKLFVHANTVKYRIGKIQELYNGIAFNDPDCYLLFMTAFRLHFMKSRASSPNSSIFT